MNDIITKENSELNIDRLAAQRHLYSQAKNYSNVIFVLCVAVPILLSFAKVIASSWVCLAQIAIIYSFFATFVKYALSGFKNGKRNLAARIQQLFDCELFNLDWSEALCGAKPIPEQIYKAQKGVDRTTLANWYEPVISNLSHEHAVIVCQRTNVVYDQNIRSYYSTLINVVFIVSVAIVFVTGLLLKKGIWEWFLNGIIPVMPIVSWYLDLHKQNESNLNALNKLQSLIDSALTEAEAGNPLNKEKLQRIQDFMYMHRNTSYTIPDLVYKLKRNNSEAATYYSAEQLCNRLLHR